MTYCFNQKINYKEITQKYKDKSLEGIGKD